MKDENRSGSLHSDRSRKVASRIGPALETELAAKHLSLGQPIFIRIFKESDELELWMEPEPGANWVLFKTWPICEWSGELGPKLKEGDGQSPEGFYFVPPARMNPESRFHLSFDLGFPNEYDQFHKRTGSFLMVHGNCVSIGCYAMTDPGIEEIYTLAAAALDNGQEYFRVHAFPFRMTDDKMDTLKEDAKWFEFWSNLKEGYDYFEFLHRPPNVTVSADGKYHFE
ncbi:MAG: murein L,D-transpeptidase [Verrucomicrobiae bacterium]|nr:murein L,D-transpeptidase [Verrucomicrobiae bacterium]